VKEEHLTFLRIVCVRAMRLLSVAVLAEHALFPRISRNGFRSTVGLLNYLTESCRRGRVGHTPAMAIKTGPDSGGTLNCETKIRCLRPVAVHGSRLNASRAEQGLL
jgi:hypothetical protein